MKKVVTIVLSVVAVLLSGTAKADILCEYSFEGTLGNNISL